MDNSRCVVLVPVHYNIEPEVQDALDELRRRDYPVIVLRGSSAIDMARNTLVTKALDAGYAETMWIDADVVFDPNDVDKLRAHNLPFTCGLYPKKGRREFAGKFGPQIKDIVFGTGGGLVPMDHVGMGFTHVRAEVYRTIIHERGMRPCKGGYDGGTVFPLFKPLIAADGTYLAEDAAFCQRARGAGFDIVADTRIRLDHIGPRKWCWEDFGPQKRYETLTFSVGDTNTEPRELPITEEKPPVSDALYAKIGKLQCRIEEQNDQFDALLRFTADIVSGAVDPSRVVVNLTKRSVDRSPDGEFPAIPFGDDYVTGPVPSETDKLKLENDALKARIQALEADVLIAQVNAPGEPVPGE